MLDSVSVPVIIVGFRTPEDIAACLAALALGPAAPTFGVFICENGGAEAHAALVAALSAPGGPCEGPVADAASDVAAFARCDALTLRGGRPVVVAQATANLGYAGAINASLEALAPSRAWQGAWVLNPDTEPEPNALPEMLAYAAAHAKGMVGSRLMYVDNPDIVRTRGLRWRRWSASVEGVDIYAPLFPAPAPGSVDDRIDSPSGASFYITRECIDRIGPMDERYFLYMEDLDWGMRAKASCGIGYAFDSVVPHIGGRSIGTSAARAGRSRLAVYLGARNTLIFVRSHYPRWFAWTALVLLLRSGEYLAVGAIGNFIIALRGIWAGLTGEIGRPDHIMADHAAKWRAPETPRLT